MKFFILIFFLLTNVLIFCQDEEQYPENEFTIQIENAIQKTIVFEMIPIGANWAKTLNGSLYLYNDNTTYISTLSGQSIGYIICALNGFEYRFYNEGNYTSVEGCASSTAGLKPLRNGFYRINVKENGVLKTYAYFDWRDLDFTTGWINCSGNDMTVRYDANLGKLKFFNTSNVDLNTQIDLILNTGDVITWADWRCDFRSFTPFWSNGLVLAPDASNHPRIVWGPYGDISGSSLTYKVYKAVNYSSTPPPLSSFNLIASVSESTYDYTDEDFVVGGNLYFHYYIKCSYVPTGKSAAVFTPPTNVVTTEASLSYKITEENRHFANDYLLNQNYPNPFNPSTKILYSIKEEGLVTLKVYDVLGKEIATLVNENRPAGTYEAEFNASQLPSGMYIYKIQAGQFSDARKMILTK